MDYNTLIEKIYSETIGTVLNNTNKELNDELSKSYKEYLLNIYFPKDFNNDRLSTNEILQRIIDIEISRWKDLSEYEKMQRLIKDDAFKKIIEISNKAYELAKTKLYNSTFGQNIDYIPIGVKEANDSIEELEELFKKIKNFNYEEAQTLVSEGIMDFLYVSGQTEGRSIRLGREFGDIQYQIK